jgi:hypothetical protein
MKPGQQQDHQVYTFRFRVWLEKSSAAGQLKINERCRLDFTMWLQAGWHCKISSHQSCVWLKPVPYLFIQDHRTRFGPAKL